MRVTITEYRNLAQSAEGDDLPLGGGRITVQSRTSNGAFSALSDLTRFIRIASDTAITLDIDGGTTDELFLAGVEFMAVQGGEVLTVTSV